MTQDYRTGRVEVVDVPAPTLRPDCVLVRTVASLISTGTERGKIALARKSLLAKARERPEAVRQTLDVIRREGLRSAYRRVGYRLNRLSPLGYSAAGIVTDVGSDVTRFRKGDRVAVGGGGYANHAEVLSVPENLAARVPESVPLEHAAFTTVAAIPLHAMRVGRAMLGETVAVVGLGLVGQLAVRLARSAGCVVVGCDPAHARSELAQTAGASAVSPEAMLATVLEMTEGIGADVVLVTATSTSPGPMRLAADVARDRGRVVAVGAVGMELPREPFYRKELQLTVSRSYGPGRYDPRYEEHGIDYPIAYVRWTEGRNLGAVVRQLAEGALEVESLISRRYELANAPEAYDVLIEGDPAIIGVILKYPAKSDQSVRTAVAVAPAPVRARGTTQVGIGLIGVGSFASNVLIPALGRAGARLVAVASASGLSARDAVRRHGFARAVDGVQEVIADPEVDAVVIATPHHLHASVAVAAAQAGKAVLVEKPLAIRTEELEKLRTLGPDAPILVGFNRRFSPHLRFLRTTMPRARGAALVNVRVNAGAVTRDSWIHDPRVGGGRLIGEGCHFVDLCSALVGNPPVAIQAVGIGGGDPDAALLDNFVITVAYSDGSVATITYTSKGDSRLDKERVEVFDAGRSGVIENFNRTVVFCGRRGRVYRARASKGHEEEVAAFVAAVRHGTEMPIGFNELLLSTEATLAAQTSLLRGGERVQIG